MDDGRQVTTGIRKGIRFEEKTGKFEERENWKKEDDEAKETTMIRMKRECLKAMNFINPDLKFTV